MAIDNINYENVYIMKNDTVKEVETIYFVNKIGNIGFDTYSVTEWRLSK